MTDPVLAHYDALLLDLDGTVYRGGVAVDGAEPAVQAAHRAGVAVRFVTNNASRSPEEVADQLNRLGIPAKHDEVTTSAQAGAGMLVDRVSPGADVLILGTGALAAEVRARGFTPVRAVGDGVTAVVQGLSQDLGWRDLAEACVAIRAGALWVACNVDATLPTERGLLPGNGALVAALVAATDSHPLVAGKPERPLMDDAIRATGAQHPLAVGDRLDTDITGAVNVGIDSLLVLTGVATPAILLAATKTQRPTYVSADLRGVTQDRSEVRVAPHPDWQVEPTSATELTLSYTGSAEHPDPLTALRTLCAKWWPHNAGPAKIHPADPQATRAVTELNLPTA
jgi:glycerol 3-phosphatase-2